jgi:hypothetical protein
MLKSVIEAKEFSTAIVLRFPTSRRIEVLRNLLSKKPDALF